MKEKDHQILTINKENVVNQPGHIQEKFIKK